MWVYRDLKQDQINLQSMKQGLQSSGFKGGKGDWLRRLLVFLSIQTDGRSILHEVGRP